MLDLKRPSIKKCVSGSLVRQVRVVPQWDCYAIEVIYQQPESPHSSGAGIAAIDFNSERICPATD